MSSVFPREAEIFLEEPNVEEGLGFSLLLVLLLVTCLKGVRCGLRLYFQEKVPV